MTAVSIAAAPPRPRTGRNDRTVGVAQALAGAYGLWAFALGSRTAHGAKAVFGLALLGQSGAQLGDLTVPAQATAASLATVSLLCGLVRATVPVGVRVRRLLTLGYLIAFVLAFMVWAAAGRQAGSVNIAGILQNTLVAAVPLTLGALCGAICERSGVVNIAIEGQFLVGAFAAAMAATMTHSLWAGVLAGCLGGVLMGALLAVFANRYHIEQVVLGVVLNLLAGGLTGFLFDRLMSSDSATYNNPPIFNAIRVPGLADIPLIGPVLFDENVLCYATYVLTAVVHIALFRTRWGLRTRAVGEHPTAADTVGVKVLGTRYRNVVMAGAISGLGGVWLTIGQVGAFTKNISSGMGFISLAALIFGRWSPLGAMGAALLFGFATGLNDSFGSLGTPIPSQFLAMAPYLATIFAVAGLVGRVRPPAASNRPYLKS
ncbi:ABC transporter permease [Streptomyces sp. NPDC002788]